MIKSSAVLTLATILLAPLSTHASQWTAAGVTGTIASYNIRVVYAASVPLFYQIAAGNASGMSYSSSSSSGTDPFTVVYNVTSDEPRPLWTTLKIGYSGVVSGTSIGATLYRVTPTTGSRAAICSINGTTSTTVGSCTFSSSSFDFSNYAYYVEVVVDRSSSSQLPTINYLGIN